MSLFAGDVSLELTFKGFNMKISLHLYASLASHLPPDASGNSCIIELEDGMTVGQVLAEFNIPPESPKIVFLNGLHSRGEEALKEGDRLAVFPPIAGG